MYEKFIVHTDHVALSCLFNITEPSDRFVRWRLRLAEFEFQITYKKGINNTQSYALSRLSTLAEIIYDKDWEEIPAFMLKDT